MTSVRAAAGHRIATLDGLRGVSIVLVLFGHAFGTGVLPMSRCSHVVADLGVRCFFVISGFLISTLLLRESAARGRISLKRFYARRSLRIFPSFYGYLAVISVLAVLGLVAVGTRDLVRAATYTMNFRGERPWLVGHLWSLAVEEQFYLLWPLALVLLGIRRAGYVVLGALVCAPIVRVCTWYFVPGARDLADQAFPCVFDSLAVGCGLAIARGRLERSVRYLAWQRSRWFFPSCLAGVALVSFSRPWFELGVAATVANVSIAMVLHWCVTHPQATLGRVLESRALVWVGASSYSLYLWQQPFLDRHAHLWINAFPINMLLALAAATLWYRLVERRLTALRARSWPQEVTVVTVPVLDLSLPTVIDVSSLHAMRSEAPARSRRESELSVAVSRR